MNVKTMLAAFSFVVVGALLSPAQADVVPTSLFRDIQLFASVSQPGEDPIFESRNESSSDLGDFQSFFDLFVSDGDVEAHCDGGQTSDLSSSILTASGGIFCSASAAEPEAFGESFSASRIFFDFDVDEPTPVQLTGVLRAQAGAKVSMNLIGPGTTYTIFLEDEERRIEEIFWLQPGPHQFSFVLSGFGSHSEGVSMTADGGYFFTLEFLDDVATVGEAPLASLPTRVFPNPASESLEIQFSSPRASASGELATVEVVDATGRSIRVLPVSGRPSISEPLTRTTWDLRDSAGERVSAGVYYVKVAGSEAVRTVVLQRR